jgi:hypothetical protein
VLNYLRKRRDFFAGGLMVLIGLGTGVEGTTLRIGSLRQMGPGFFPTALGVILAFVGVLIVLGARQPAGIAGDDDDAIPDHPEWRGWLCILAGPILFIILGAYAGLLPATFACVFVASLGDRTTTVKEALVLATGVTIFGVILFSYVLHVSFPILRWHYD